jgi:hypothetical protein
MKQSGETPGDPVGPEALHMHSYFPVPRQRLVHSQRQAGTIRFSLSSTSARCSSLTGPACLYGPVLADPAAGEGSRSVLCAAMHTIVLGRRVHQPHVGCSRATGGDDACPPDCHPERRRGKGERDRGRGRTEERREREGGGEKGKRERRC